MAGMIDQPGILYNAKASLIGQLTKWVEQATFKKLTGPGFGLKY